MPSMMIQAKLLFNLNEDKNSSFAVISVYIYIVFGLTLGPPIFRVVFNIIKKEKNLVLKM